MTTPFQFPNIQQGSTIMDPGLGGNIASGLAAVLKAQQDAQELKRQQAEFEQKQQYYKTLNEGSALDNIKKKDEITAEKRKLEAANIANEEFTRWAGSGAKFEDVGKIVSSGRFKGNPEAAQAFVSSVHDHFTNLHAAASAQQAATDAEITAKTEPDVIAKAGSDAATAGVNARVATATEGEQKKDAKAVRQLHEAEVTKALAEAAGGGADQSTRLGVMDRLYKSGTMDLGQAAKAAGVTLDPGVDPKQRFDPTVQTQRMATYKATQKAAASAALLANAEIDDLESKGVTIGRLTKLKMDYLPGDIGNQSIPESEQALVAANGQLASQYLLSISGKAATDKESARTARQITAITGDKPQVRAQKRLMREAMVQIMTDQAHGATTPMSQIIDHIIGAARAKGAEPGSIKFLQESRMRALEMERLAEKSPDEVPITAGSEPATSDSLNSVLGTYGR